MILNLLALVFASLIIQNNACTRLLRRLPQNQIADPSLYRNPQTGVPYLDPTNPNMIGQPSIANPNRINSLYPGSQVGSGLSGLLGFPGLNDGVPGSTSLLPGSTSRFSPGYLTGSNIMGQPSITNPNRISSLYPGSRIGSGLSGLSGLTDGVTGSTSLLPGSTSRLSPVDLTGSTGSRVGSGLPGISSLTDGVTGSTSLLPGSNSRLSPGDLTGSTIMNQPSNTNPNRINSVYRRPTIESDLPGSTIVTDRVPTSTSVLQNSIPRRRRDSRFDSSNLAPNEEYGAPNMMRDLSGLSSGLPYLLSSLSNLNSDSFQESKPESSDRVILNSNSYPRTLTPELSSTTSSLIPLSPLLSSGLPNLMYNLNNLASSLTPNLPRSTTNPSNLMASLPDLIMAIYTLATIYANLNSQKNTNFPQESNPGLLSSILNVPNAAASNMPYLSELTSGLPNMIGYKDEPNSYRYTNDYHKVKQNKKDLYEFSDEIDPIKNETESRELETEYKPNIPSPTHNSKFGINKLVGSFVSSVSKNDKNDADTPKKNEQDQAVKSGNVKTAPNLQ